MKDVKMFGEFADVKSGDNEDRMKEGEWNAAPFRGRRTSVDPTCSNGVKSRYFWKFTSRAYVNLSLLLYFSFDFNPNDDQLTTFADVFRKQEASDICESS